MTEVTVGAPPPRLLVEPATDQHATDAGFPAWVDQPAAPAGPEAADGPEGADGPGRPDGLVTARTPIDAELARAVTATAATLGLPEYTLHVTAHLKMLAVLTAEQRVAASLDLAGDEHAVDLALPGGSWAELISAVAAAVNPDPAQRGQTRLCHGRPPGQLPAETVLQIWCAPDRLWLWGRPEHCDRGYLDRIGQYHLAVLQAMTVSPHATSDVGLVGPAEAEFQLHRHDAGQRELPDRRAHELFAAQARRDPTAVALGYRGTRWTYRDLDDRAGRVARLLAAQRLPREGVVAVVSERDPAWVAAMLGIFQSGGVYLPIDPGYPAERIAVMLRQSGAWAVLSPDPVSEPLRDALGRIAADGADPPRLLPISGDPDPTTARPGSSTDPGPAATSGHTGPAPGRAPATAVEPHQAAYIYFTSGSTGRPKGALLEHAGMLNHLLAKVDTLRLGPDSVVVQNAPICFDISLWQVMAPLLVGGRVELVPTADIVEVSRFVSVLQRCRATVLQVVPSYLDLLLTELSAHGGRLPQLRYVSVTGEALSRALVERWFARFPDVALVNAYGATEASDDTTHAVLTRPPDATAAVSLGSPIPNVAVYVIDEQLRLVPLGAPGEIVFSGICVGRGYINDPERTAEAFGDDPFRPGRRWYRTGDYGRWLPSGELEFLGRRDEQVKIRGFRVELGEIEQRMLDVAGVGSAAVLVRHRGERGEPGEQLVGFYTGDPDLTPALLLTRLRQTLPAHAVPAVCHRLPVLPLTENGKTDKRKLAELAQRAGTGAGTVSPPRTPAEQALARLWSQLLNRPLADISREDDFFACGGDSLAAARLVVRLDRAVSFDDLLRRPVLHQLAALLTDAVPAFSDSGPDGMAD